MMNIVSVHGLSIFFPSFYYPFLFFPYTNILDDKKTVNLLSARILYHYTINCQLNVEKLIQPN